LRENMRPELNPDNITAIPAGLQSRRQWVLWRYESRPGDPKPTKVPYQPSGRTASHADPATWISFAEATAAAPRFDGLGFVFTADDPYCGIDLDGCYTPDGTLRQWAVEIVESAQDAECYIERTPSGLGLHIIGQAVFGKGRKQKHAEGAVEVYDRLRYFTMSGDQISIGDVDSDASIAVSVVARKYLTRPESESTIEVDPGTGIADYQADALAAQCLAGASADFLSHWHDKIDVTRHGGDRSAHRLSLVNKVAMKLASCLGRPATISEVRAVCLRAPFIRYEMTAARSKWPRLAKEECAKGIRWATEHVAPGAPGVAPANEPMLLTLAQLAERAQSIRWVVKGIIPDDSIGVIFGASGTFKSFLALDFSLHVAHGLPWLGKKTQQGSVVYIAAEGGAGLWRRIEAWHKQRNFKWAGIPLYVCPYPLTLATEAPALAEAVKKLCLNPRVIIVDTMSQTFTGEENSATDVANFFRGIGRDLRAVFRCAVPVVHHSGHSATERPRGSSALIANVDWMYGVFRDEKEMIATVTCLKQKDADKLADVSFSLTVEKLGTDDDGDPISSLVATHIDTAGQLIAAIKAEARSGRSGNRQIFLSVVGDGVSEEVGRSAFYDQMGDKDANAKRQAWHKCRTWAIEAGIVSVFHGRLVLREQGK